MSQDAMIIKYKGIKCDNPECDYQDSEVSANDYIKYVNKPCPKCGSILLTENDFRFCILSMEFADFVNKHVQLPDSYDRSNDLVVDIELCGNDTVNFKVREE